MIVNRFELSNLDACVEAWHEGICFSAVRFFRVNGQIVIRRK